MIKENIVFCICDFETTGLDSEKDLPVEIGCIFTDSRFNKLEEYESFIRWPRELLFETIDNETTIKREHMAAYNVHKIDYDELLKGKTPNKVIKDLFFLVNKHKPKFGKVILLSDNIRFEWGFMQKLFGSIKVESLFHYAGWDTNLLLEVSGIGDPVPVHRAMSDVKLLHSALLKLRKSTNC